MKKIYILVLLMVCVSVCSYQTVFSQETCERMHEGEEKVIEIDFFDELADLPQAPNWEHGEEALRRYNEALEVPAALKEYNISGVNHILLYNNIAITTLKGGKYMNAALFKEGDNLVVERVWDDRITKAVYDEKGFVSFTEVEIGLNKFI